MIGKTIKDFKLVERLGKGGWGEVWAAEQQIVKTRVEIRLLRSEVSGDQAHVMRLFNEAIAAGKIPHAGIVKIFDSKRARPPSETGESNRERTKPGDNEKTRKKPPLDVFDD